MSLNIEKKKNIVKESLVLLEKSSSIAIINYSGLNCKKMSILRNLSRKNDIITKIIPNNLILKALNQSKSFTMNSFKHYIKNQLLFMFAKDNLSIIAKTIKLLKDLNINLLFFIIEKKIYEKDQLNYLANLPSKKEILSKLVYILNKPITDLLYVIKKPVENLRNTFYQIKEKKINK